MTRFWREGHWRTSSLGTLYWVDGHWVDRDDWDRYSSAPQKPFARPKEVSLRASTYMKNEPLFGPFSWSEPNAICPVCGQAVFFYQNENGSRVFFDQLGPPWLKHPCTDIQSVPIARRTQSQAVLEHDTALNPQETGAVQAGWIPYEVIRIKVRKRPFVTLEAIMEEPREVVLGWVHPNKPVTNTIVFLRGQRFGS